MITFYNYTFGELVLGKEPGFKDPYNIASSLCDNMKDAIIHNPSGYSDDEVCQILALDDDVVVGCTNPFSGRIKVDGEIIPVQQGSTLFSHEKYRKDNVGGELFMRIINLHPSKNCYFSGISHMAMGLYKVMKFTIFEFPRLIYLRHCKSVVRSIFKSESSMLNPIIWIGDFCLWCHRKALDIYKYFAYFSVKVVESTIVPDEVEEIIKMDPHPFAEIHDKTWIEWNLKYKFTNQPRIKKLFLIKKNNQTVAFFITKEQFFRQASRRGFKNVNLGSVVEWGIHPSSSLTEKDVYLLSINYFSQNIDGIQFATTDCGLAHRLKRFLFVGIGKANVGFKIKSVKDERLKDINNWRIRLAASDTLLD